MKRPPIRSIRCQRCRPALWLAIGLLCLTLTIGGALGVAALTRAPVDHAADNYAAQREATDALQALSEGYRSVATAAGSDRWVEVLAAITHYGDNHIQALFVDDRYKTESLVEDIARYRAMGAAAGEVTWLYYAHVDTLPLAARTEVTATYREIFTDIEAVTRPSQATLTYTYARGGFAARMYAAIYGARLAALLREGDSDAVTARVAHAQAEILSDTCVPVAVEGQVGTSDEYYRAALDGTARAVTVQRDQEAAMAQLQAVFEILNPGTSVSEHAGMVAALGVLDTDTTDTIPAIHDCLKAAIDQLLDEQGAAPGGYTDGYFTTLREGISVVLSDANAAGTVADVRPVFDGYEIRLTRASAKDDLVAYVADRGLSEDAVMIERLARYTRTWGILDGCTTAESVAFERTRCMLLVDLHAAYRNAEALVTVYGGEAETIPTVLASIARQYGDTVTLITANHPTTPDEAKCRAYYQDCLTFFYRETAGAEVNAFLIRHADILGRTIESVTGTAAGTAEAETALLAALRELADMHAPAMDKFAASHAAQLTDLTEKYRAVIGIRLGERLPADTPRGAYAVLLAERLARETLTAAHPSALAAWMPAMAGYLSKADGIATLYDLYEHICAADAYASYAEADREALLAQVQTAALALVRAEPTDGQPLTEILAAVTAEGIASLHRAEAYAALHRKAAACEGASEAVVAAVQAILSAAQEAIDAETDAAGIRALTEAALLDMTRVCVAGEMSDAVDWGKDALSEKGFLTDVERNTWAEAMDACLPSAEAALQAAADADALEDIKEGFLRSLQEILDAADTANETAGATQKTAGREQISQALTLTLEGIRRTVFLSDDERAALIRRAETLAQAAVSRADATTTTAAHLSAVNALVARLTDLREEVAVADVAAAQLTRDEAADALARAHREFMAALDGMIYLTDTRRNEDRVKAEDAVRAFETAVARATTPDEIAAALSEAETTLGKLQRAAYEADTAEAGSVVLTLLMAERDRLVAMINDRDYLRDGDRAALKEEAQALFWQAYQGIDAATDAATVQNLKTDTLAAMDVLAEKIAAWDDERCLDTLTPVLILLAGSAVVEIAALVILAVRRRRCSAGIARRAAIPMAATVPAAATPAAATPVAATTAWALVWFLAILDAVLAVAIVYLILRTPRRRPAGVAPWPDGVRILDEPLIRDRLPSPDGSPRLVGAKLIYLMPPAAVMPAVRASVTVEEADALISDEHALHCVESDREDTEVYRGGKRAEINVDVLARYFHGGETVTLNSLKKKGLLPRSVGHVKILGRGRMDKPLTVIAQGFSASAVKMIVLTEGRAVLTEGAAERWTRSKKR